VCCTQSDNGRRRSDDSADRGNAESKRGSRKSSLTPFLLLCYLTALVLVADFRFKAKILPMHEIIHYLDEAENDLYQDWLDSLRDRVAKVAIIKRVARMEVGLFGDCKPLREGVWELKVDVGAAYRVYYAHVGNRVIMLTSGADKKSQSRDIERAVKLLKDWEKRNG